MTVVPTDEQVVEAIKDLRINEPGLGRPKVLARLKEQNQWALSTKRLKELMAINDLESTHVTQQKSELSEDFKPFDGQGSRSALLKVLERLINDYAVPRLQCSPRDVVGIMTRMFSAISEFPAIPNVLLLDGYGLSEHISGSEEYRRLPQAEIPANAIAAQLKYREESPRVLIIYGRGQYNFGITPNSIDGVHYMSIFQRFKNSLPYRVVEEDRQKIADATSIRVVWEFYEMSAKYAGVSREDVGRQFEAEWGVNMHKYVPPRLSADPEVQRITTLWEKKRAEVYKECNLPHLQLARSSGRVVWDERKNGMFRLIVTKIDKESGEETVSIGTNDPGLHRLAAENDRLRTKSDMACYHLEGMKATGSLGPSFGSVFSRAYASTNHDFTAFTSERARLKFAIVDEGSTTSWPRGHRVNLCAHHSLFPLTHDNLRRVLDAFALKQSGLVRLTVVARSNYDAIEKNGMTFRSDKFGDHVKGWKPDRLFPAVADAADQAYDYTFVATKVIPEVITTEEILAPLLTKSYSERFGQPTYVLLQNGVGVERGLYSAIRRVEEEMSRTEGSVALAARIVSTCVYCMGNLIAPDVVEYVEGHRLVIGAFRPGTVTITNNDAEETEILNELKGILEAGGGTVEIVPEIQRRKLEKNMLNLGFATLATLSNHPIHTIFRPPPDPDSKEQYDSYVFPATASLIEEYTISNIKAVFLEVVALGRGLGFPDSEEGIPTSIANKFLELTRANHLNPKNNHAPSMLLDMRAGKPMEVEVIVGEVVRLARRVGVDLPRIETLYSILLVVQNQILKRLAEQKET
ncbi:hypothetical protein V5O48_016019 [Marasmius crinis-equi]|uniref:Ketopantoate reductase C-terminal domain-containing protein n=1 Tax=Marasmius crinis-equi TaxID=585013 RepID=A0ABR3ESW3_9AGAR